MAEITLIRPLLQRSHPVKGPEMNPLMKFCIFFYDKDDFPGVGGGGDPK